MLNENLIQQYSIRKKDSGFPCMEYNIVKNNSKI